MNKNNKNVVFIALLMFVAYATDCEGQNPPRGAAKGMFSVSSTQKVYFASGNLQYQPSTCQWRFAANTWDYVGTQIPDHGGNSGGTVGGSDNSNISQYNNGWIDLFGWGTGDNPTKHSIEYDDSYSTFFDWGRKYGKGWRTPTYNEWYYLLNQRNTMSNIRFAKAIVNGVRGMILLPDDWNKALYDLSETNNLYSAYDANSISYSNWNSIFASAGAVFLPAAGCRHGSTVSRCGTNGYYWTSTLYSGIKGSADVVSFGERLEFMTSWSPSYAGHSVRLVHSVEN